MTKTCLWHHFSSPKGQELSCLCCKTTLMSDCVAEHKHFVSVGKIIAFTTFVTYADITSNLEGTYSSVWVGLHTLFVTIDKMITLNRFILCMQEFLQVSHKYHNSLPKGEELSSLCS